MTVFQAIVLGVIQGLTEFLPISSSGHLFLAPYLFGWERHELAFDVALHVGTLVAVLWYFKQEWANLIRAAIGIVVQRRVEGEEARRVVLLIIATLPAVVAGLVLEEQAETVFRDTRVVASTLIGLGILLWWVDRVARSDRTLATMRWRDAVLLGFAQALAIVPGVSRSGATITAGRSLGIGREGAAVFSFLMSMPIIAGAAMLKVPEVVRDHGVTLPMVAGVVSAAVSGWLAITVLLKFVARRSYGVFAAYRVVLGLIIFALVTFRGV